MTVSIRSQEMFVTLLAERYSYGLCRWNDGTYYLSGASPASPLGNRSMTLDEVAALLTPQPYDDDECPF